MLHRNPQGWFSHGAPPTDELNTSPRGPPVAAPVHSTDSSLLCVVLCHPSHEKKLVPVPKLPVSRAGISVGVEEPEMK